MAERKRHGRKLLIASIGVAAVSYVACGGDTNDTSSTDGGSSGSATAGRGPNPGPGGSNNTGGGSNTGGSTNAGGASGGNIGGQINVGNLMPYPFDAGSDASAMKDAAVEKAVMGFDVLVANLIAPPPPDAKGQ